MQGLRINKRAISSFIYFQGACSASVAPAIITLFTFSITRIRNLVMYKLYSAAILLSFHPLMILRYFAVAQLRLVLFLNRQNPRNSDVQKETLSQVSLFLIHVRIYKFFIILFFGSTKTILTATSTKLCFPWREFVLFLLRSLVTYLPLQLPGEVELSKMSPDSEQKQML